MELPVEETRRQLLSWVESEELLLGGNGDSPLRQFKERAKACRDLKALTDLEVELWRSVGYERLALGSLRRAGELIFEGLGRRVCPDAIEEVFKFVDAFTIMPSSRKPGMWVLMKKVEEGMTLLGYDTQVIAQAEYILERAFREGKLDHVLATQ